MAKQRHEEARHSSKTAYVVMVLGAVVVVALLGWALTRQVEPATGPETTGIESPVATQQPPAAGDTAAAAPPPVSTGDRASVARISVEDARAKANRGEIVVVDVRDPVAFQASHIPGAISMPYATVEAQVDTLPKNKQIVTYCT